jgi:hypothetical protein
MRADTKLRSSERPCSFDHFLHSLGHTPAPALRPIPRTLRHHIGAREFGDFGAVLMAEKPASDDLSDRVAHWRTVERSTRQDLPLHGSVDHSASDRLFNLIFLATPAAIMIWVVVGLVVAALAGKL